MTSVEATDDRTVVMTVKKPTPIMLHLYVYILPEHIWKDIDEKEVKSFANEPGPGRHRRVRPVHRRGAQEGPVHPARGQQELLQGRAEDRRAGVPGLPEPGLARPGAARAARSTSPTTSTSNVFDSLEGRRGRDDLPGDVLRLRRDRLQHRRRARRRHADRRRPPGAEGRQAAAGAVLRHRHARRWSSGCSAGTARPGTQRHPAALRVACTTTRATTAYTFDPEKAKTLLDEAGYTEGAGRHPHHAERRSQAVVPAVRPEQLADQPADGAVRHRLAGGHRHRGEAEDRVRGRPHRDHRRGQLRHVRVGLGGRARPELPAVRRSPAPTGRTRTAAASTPTCPTRSTATRSTTPLYAQQSEQIDPAERAETVKADAEDALRRSAPYVVTAYYDNLRPTAPTGSPASSRSRRRTARCCSSTARTATRTSGR